MQKRKSPFRLDKDGLLLLNIKKSMKYTFDQSTGLATLTLEARQIPQDERDAIRSEIVSFGFIIDQEEFDKIHAYLTGQPEEIEPKKRGLEERGWEWRL
jgi:hypothetical protein